MKVVRRPRDERRAVTQERREFEQRAPAPRRLPSSVSVPISQDEARECRRVGYMHVYGEDFDVVAEVRALCGDVDGVIAASLSGPVLVGDVVPREVSNGKTTYTDYYAEYNGRPVPGWSLTRPQVLDLAAAVHALWEAVVKLLASRGALSQDARAAVHDVREIPLTVTDEQLEVGGWVETLVERVAPLAADLSTVLGRGGGARTARSAPDPISDELRAALLVLDHAADALSARVPKVQAMYAPTRRWFAERAAAEQTADREQIARLGL